MEDYIVVSFSGGKDSTAMLLHMIELGEKIDEIIYCDTTVEFPDMVNHIEKVKKIVEEKGYKFTTLRAEHDYKYMLLDFKRNHRHPEEYKKKYGDTSGYGWAFFKNRWCTGYFKREIVDRYLVELRKKYNVIQCVGIAIDETKRLEKPNQKQANHRHPLVEWGWTEADALTYCYNLGFDWNGLYKYFNRVSCWCCPLQSLDNLKKLWKLFPTLWQELLDMDKKCYWKFRADYSVEELGKRFAFEEEWVADGKKLRTRAFYSALKEVLANAADKP